MSKDTVRGALRNMLRKDRCVFCNGVGCNKCESESELGRQMKTKIKHTTITGKCYGIGIDVAGPNCNWKPHKPYVRCDKLRRYRITIEEVKE